MGHETLFLSPVRSKTKMKKKNPKKRIDLRPKPAVKEAEINQENKQTKSEIKSISEHLTNHGRGLALTRG
jgi:hypothetical protein